MKTRLKSKHVCCFSSIALLLFSILSPCLCFANAPVASDTAESQAHSHCSGSQAGDGQGEQQSTPSENEHDCDGCTHCAEISASTYNFVIKAELTQPENQDRTSTTILSFTWLSNPPVKYNSGPRQLGPPGLKITSSSTLSKLLHRWLV